VAVVLAGAVHREAGKDELTLGSPFCLPCAAAKTGSNHDQAGNHMENIETTSEHNMTPEAVPHFPLSPDPSPTRGEGRNKPARAARVRGQPVISAKKGQTEQEHLREIGSIYVQLLTAMKGGRAISTSDAAAIIDPPRNRHTVLNYLYDLVGRGFARIEKRLVKKSYGGPAVFFGLKDPDAELPGPDDFAFLPCREVRERDDFEVVLLDLIKKNGSITANEAHKLFPNRSVRLLRAIFSDMEKKGMIRVERIQQGHYNKHTNFYFPVL
jgi:hypothetical protein